MGCCSSNKYGLVKQNGDEIELDEANQGMINKLIMGYTRDSIQDLLPHDIEIIILYFFVGYGFNGNLIIRNNETLTLGRNGRQKYQFGSIKINKNGTLKCAQHQPLFIVCFGDVILEKGAKIDLNGMGYFGGNSIFNGESYKRGCFDGESYKRCCCPNYGGGGGECGGGGGGGGGYGECGGCNPFCWLCPCFCCCLCCGWGGCKYGDKELTTLHVGSGGGGGAYRGRGGNGGGAIRLQCFGRVLLKENARITCNGKDGGNVSRGGGGGSGGSIHIVINDKNKLFMHITSMISAKGGRGGKDLEPDCCFRSGDGGDGRIRIEFVERNKALDDEYNIKPQPYIS